MIRLVPAAIALAAIAAWPATALLGHAAPAAPPTAPAPRDYLDRDRLVAFYEREAARAPGDQILGRMLAAQYLARFHERFDLGDVDRAAAQARRSLALQPNGNDAADMTLASALLAFHDFKAALRYERDALQAVPSNDGARAQIASLEMELGRYGDAQRTLAHRAGNVYDASYDSVRARYDELTGKLSLARNLLEEGCIEVDRQYAAGAYVRSWFHFRAAQLAFEAGDDAAVERHVAESLRLYPGNAAALTLEAQWRRGRREWRASLAAARRAAQLYPLPQVLGYEADAQRALGDAAGAADTDALIDAERTLTQARGTNDRLLALYFAQRHARPREALAMARADLQRRGDEIYADDTMAWVLAAQNRWREARVYALRATRLDTEDPLLQYHAGAIAMETGHWAEARSRLSAALLRNPAFDAFYADDARARLERLR